MSAGGPVLLLKFMSDLADVARRSTRHGLPLREQAGVYFGFAVGALLGAGVKHEDVMRLAVDHVNVALAESSQGKVSQ